jgi:hypothetical protein
VALVAAGALLLASLGAGALAHFVQREAGTSAPSIQERAYFADPSDVNAGVSLLVQFVVVPSTGLPVSWVASDAGHVRQRGIVQGAAGSNVLVTLSGANLRHGTWLTVAIAGIPTPLKAWVK